MRRLGLLQIIKPMSRARGYEAPPLFLLNRNSADGALRTQSGRSQNPQGTQGGAGNKWE